MDTRLGSASDHDVRFAQTNKTGSVAERMGACRAGCRHRVVGALSAVSRNEGIHGRGSYLEPISHRNVTGAEVDENAGNKEWMNLSVILLV